MKAKTEHDRPLEGLRILIAEDEFLISVALEDTLREAGAEIVTAPNVRVALEDIAGQTLSGALLDVRLGRQTTDCVADSLEALGIPFLFYSGHGLPEGMRDKHPGAEVLLKPVTPRAVIDAVLAMVKRAKGQPSPA